MTSGIINIKKRIKRGICLMNGITQIYALKFKKLLKNLQLLIT